MAVACLPPPFGRASRGLRPYDERRILAGKVDPRMRQAGAIAMAERQDRRVRDHNDPEPWLTISRRDAGRAVAASAMLAGFFRLSRSEGQDVAQAGGVGFAARVIELQSGKPLEGVVVHVEQSVRGADPAALPLWAGESTIRTDAEGRFRLDFTPEQVAEPAMCIALRNPASGIHSP